MRHEVGVIRRTVSVRLHDMSEEDIVSVLTVLSESRASVAQKAGDLPLANHNTNAVIAFKEALEAALKSLNRGEVMAEPTRPR